VQQFSEALISFSPFLSFSLVLVCFQVYPQADSTKPEFQQTKSLDFETKGTCKTQYNFVCLFLCFLLLHLLLFSSPANRCLRNEKNYIITCCYCCFMFVISLPPCLPHSCCPNLSLSFSVMIVLTFIFYRVFLRLMGCCS
jgi:hypothetical protein